MMWVWCHVLGFSHLALATLTHHPNNRSGWLILSNHAYSLAHLLYIWCAVGVLHITAFHWCEISNKTLGGPLIILQTAGWTIQRTGDHRRGHFDWYTKVTNMFDTVYCWNPAYHTAFHWSKILNKKLAGPPIISETARWYISCTADHRTGRPSANVSNKKESKLFFFFWKALYYQNLVVLNYCKTS